MTKTFNIIFKDLNIHKYRIWENPHTLENFGNAPGMWKLEGENFYGEYETLWDGTHQSVKDKNTIYIFDVRSREIKSNCFVFLKVIVLFFLNVIQSSLERLKFYSNKSIWF